MRQYLKAIVTEVKEDGTFEAVVSTNDVDRDGEVIDQTAWETDSFRKNPVMLFGHNHLEPPIGRWENLRIEGNRMVGTPVFASEEANPKAQQIKRLFEEKIMRAFSVGFIAHERSEDFKTIKRAELLEISAVPVPANPFALRVAMAKGLGGNPELFDLDDKGPVPQHNPPKASEDRSWDGTRATRSLRRWASSDGSGDKDTIDFGQYANGFGWFDEADVDNFGAYKLPHHEVVDGRMRTVFRGVTAAMGALLGARGGVDVPERDRQPIYDHLAAHYKQFDREPPEFRAYDEGELKELFPEAKQTTEEICDPNNPEYDPAECERRRAESAEDGKDTPPDQPSNEGAGGNEEPGNGGGEDASKTGKVGSEEKQRVNVVEIERSVLRDLQRSSRLANQHQELVNALLKRVLGK